MKKALVLVAITLFSYTAFAQELPSEEKKEAIRACVKKSGVEMPERGVGKPPKLTPEQQTVVDNCFKENGVEPPPKFLM